MHGLHGALTSKEEGGTAPVRAGRGLPRDIFGQKKMRAW